MTSRGAFPSAGLVDYACFKSLCKVRISHDDNAARCIKRGTSRSRLPLATRMPTQRMPSCTLVPVLDLQNFTLDEVQCGQAQQRSHQLRPLSAKLEPHAIKIRGYIFVKDYVPEIQMRSRLEHYSVLAERTLQRISTPTTLRGRPDAWKVLWSPSTISFTGMNMFPSKRSNSRVGNT